MPAPVGHEQHNRLDETPPRLRHEADFIQDAKELLERRVAKVDDLGAGIVRDQAVEQLHLAERFSYVDRTAATKAVIRLLDKRAE